jgi:LuxR family maltose regulon positive regulatory protein
MVVKSLLGIITTSMRRGHIELTPNLTKQELAVLEALLKCDRIPQVAEVLFVQPDTVRKHLRHIYNKLGVHSIHRAIVRALELGLIQMPSRE